MNQLTLSPHYNTTGKTGVNLQVARKKTAKQSQIVFDAFLAAPRGLTPWECLTALKSANACVLITSVRRAITDLTKNGLLEKTDDLRPGPAEAGGEPSHVWRVK